MTKFLVALLLVTAFLVAGLAQLFRTIRQPMGTPEQLERAKQRNKELEEQERRERGD